MIVDRKLAQRLERAEAHANAMFVESRLRLEPSSAAAWKEIGGTYALFDGAASPLTQTFGLGMFTDADHTQLEALETFFAERQAPVFHEVSPLADASLLTLFAERRYRPVELTTLMFQPVTTAMLSMPGNARVTVERVDPGDDEAVNRWAALAAEGWAEGELVAFVRALGRVSCGAEGTHAFLARLDGKAIATGSLHVHEGVALLAGASTIPTARRQGAQQALLAARARFAVEAKCDLAIMGALPGGESERNAQRQGFRVAYTRMKWAR